MARTHSREAPLLQSRPLQARPKCHNRSSECQKRGTATEHAERKAPGGRATEHAEKKAPGSRGTLKPYAQTSQAMEDAQADRANDTVQNWCSNWVIPSHSCCKTCGLGFGMLQST